MATKIEMDLLKNDVVIIQEMQNGNYIVKSFNQTINRKPEEMGYINRKLEKDFIYFSELPAMISFGKNLPRMYVKPHMVTIIRHI